MMTEPDIDILFNSSSSSIKEKPTKWQGTFFEFDHVTDKVLASDRIGGNHEYDLEIIVRLFDETQQLCIEKKRTIDVLELWITRFEQVHHSKPWQVVVAPKGNKVPFNDHSEIRHDVHAPIYMSKFEWKMPDRWVLENNMQKSGHDLYIRNMEIPKNTEIGKNGKQIFGNENGTICVIMENPSGTTYKVCSDHDNSQTSGIGYIKIMPNSDRAKVYFHRDDDNITNDLGIDAAVIPNWFYYWEKIVPKKRIKKLEHAFIYNSKVSIFNCPGNPAWSVTTGPTHGTTVICDGVRRESGPDYMTCGGTIPIKFTNATGIEHFRVTLVHESYHYEIYDKQWNGNYQTNYDPKFDVDGDLYKDASMQQSTDWEQAYEMNRKAPPSKTNPIFQVPRDDITRGYRCYTEPACVKQEQSVNRTKFNKYDWSYTWNPVQLKFQGKNW